MEGIIAEEKNDLTKGIAYLKQAVVIEDSMVYNEPKDWVHPARQYLGNILLKAKRYKEAVHVFEEDLKINPNNGWSLTGLATALSKGGQKQKGLEIYRQTDKAFIRKDVPIRNAVF